MTTRELSAHIRYLTKLTELVNISRLYKNADQKLVANYYLLAAFFPASPFPTVILQGLFAAPKKKIKTAHQPELQVQQKTCRLNSIM